MLRLVHIELVGAHLLVHSAGHGVGLRRLNLVLYLAGSVVRYLQIIIEQTACRFLFLILSAKLFELGLDDFRYFELKDAGVSLEL